MKIKSKLKEDRKAVRACGGKRGKGCSSNWAGATTMVTKVKAFA